MPLLTSNDLHKAFGSTVVLDGAELHLARGERIGLVGRNGTGKSSLLRVLAGIDAPDSGTIALRSGSHVALLAQDPSLGDAKTLFDVAYAGAMRCREELDPHERQIRADVALKALGVPDPLLPVAIASGGTRRRAALAAALLQKPDLLLLDEPTNHLDAETAAWLETELKSLPGALVLVTHDRYFLNQVVDRIVELRRGKMYGYEGTFQDYLEARMDEDALADRTEANRRNRMRTELDWLRRSPAARSTKPRARIQRAEALMQTDYQVEKRMLLPTLGADRLGKTILEARALKVGYPPGSGFPDRDLRPSEAANPQGRVLIDHLDLLLVRGDRLGIVGPNGAGKTTLLETLAGRVKPLSGKLVHGINTKILTIDQHRTGLDPDRTVAEEASPAGGEWVRVGEDKVHVATWLEQFLFKSADLRQKVCTLSGGQRFRLLLARRLQEPMNVLLLDEPTNDLDFETLEVLEEGLLAWPGCLLVVSHDRAFLDRICTGMLHVKGDGTVDYHQGNYSHFLENQAARKKLDRVAELAAAADRRPTERKVDASPPKLTFQEERALSTIEADIQAAEAQVATGEAAMADPEVTSDFTRLQKAMADLEAATAKRDQLYASWEMLEAKAEAWRVWKERR
jgi:ATP-binding cassette subfamily F protein uup